MTRNAFNNKIKGLYACVLFSKPFLMVYTTMRFKLFFG